MNLLERHFNIALETPDGIKKLRELILTLAMQGKLVPQDPKDQSASELLKEIKAEKKKLVSEGKIKKQESLPPIKESELPYQIPVNWEWVRLIEYGTWKAGSTPSRANNSYYGGSIPWVKSGEVKQGIIKETSETITKIAMLNCSLALNPIGSVLVAMYGANIGEVGILDIEATTNQAVCACKTYSGIDIKFLYYLLYSLRTYFISQGAGAAQPNISRDKIVNTIVPLPPLIEQKRIVGKIDNLMAVCDKLEAERDQFNKMCLTIHTAAMNKLLTAPDSQGFNSAWGFIIKHFDHLYSAFENVADLKNAVLQLAVMGKLVPQDANDQPASELLKEIEAEKKKLIKEGKIKKQEPLASIKESEIPFELPNGWEWVRFFHINIVRSELVRPEDYPSEYQIAPDSIEKGSGVLLFDRTVFESGVKGPNHRFYKGQILYSKIRPSLSKAIIATYNGLCSADMYPIETFINSQYVLKVILSETFLAQVRFAENRVKMPKLNLESLGKFIFPLPPLNEQKRIVEKIDQLMNICNSLQQQIKDSTQKKSGILNAVLAKLEGGV